MRHYHSLCAYLLHPQAVLMHARYIRGKAEEVKRASAHVAKSDMRVFTSVFILGFSEGWDGELGGNWEI